VGRKREKKGKLKGKQQREDFQKKAIRYVDASHSSTIIKTTKIKSQFLSKTYMKFLNLRQGSANACRITVNNIEAIDFLEIPMKIHNHKIKDTRYTFSL